MAIPFTVWVFIPPNFLWSLLPGEFPVLAISCIAIIWCCLYLAAAALSVKSISEYGSFGFAVFFANFKKGCFAGFILGLICAFMLIIVFVSMPVYLGMGSILGWFLFGIIFWTFIIAIISIQFFLAFRARRQETKPMKAVKQCLIIFFDNPAFSIFCWLYNLIGLAATFFLFIIPGPACLLLFSDEALRLRILKYDWLEANPDTTGSKKRRKIPWDEILIEEREKTGSRSLRNFIFPWKD